MSRRLPLVFVGCSLALQCFLLSGCSSPEGLTAPLQPLVSVGDPSFQEEMGALLRASFLPGNRITTLNNGNEVFPAMQAAIHAARRSITFESYIYDDGKIGDALTEALAERARHGVQVKVVLDAFGANARTAAPTLEKAGAEVEYFHSFFFDPRLYDHRTHRKLMVVDGRVGFIGGVGIADDWMGGGRKPHEWRDMHYRVEGPVVAQIQEAFQDDWRKTRHEILHGPDFFPALKPMGKALASVFTNSPHHGERYTDLMLHLVIASCRKTLWIEASYFVPNNATCEALAQAVQRGVDVRIMMPGKNTDVPTVRRASQRRWPRLLAAGIKLYEYEPCMLHTKLLIADGLFVSVGSANLDPRSRSLNEEANMNVMDDAFAREQMRIFREDLKYCSRLTKASGNGFLDSPADWLESSLEDEL